MKRMKKQKGRILACVLIAALLAAQTGTINAFAEKNSGTEQTASGASPQESYVPDVSSGDVSSGNLAGQTLPKTPAGALLGTILSDYFPGVEDGGIYDAILSMDENTRLSLTAAYENFIAALTQEDEQNERLQYLMSRLQGGIQAAAAGETILAPAFYSLLASPAETAEQPVALRKTGGSGQAFIYYNFVETTSFTPGVTYAFLNGVYGPEDAVSMLGSGAILTAKEDSNNSSRYIRRWYGEDAQVRVYVDVVTKGKGFDTCPSGGLYAVPGTENPVAYRYFCWAGGAQNCGPLYAYTYETATLTQENVSAALNDLEDCGSEDSEDYTVTLSFDNRTVTLNPDSYKVQVENGDEITIQVSDDGGNTITALFQGPLAVHYDGSSEDAGNVPAVQEAWRGEEISLSSGRPTRTGYEFQGWKDRDGSETYQPGDTLSLQQILYLAAQWKDVQPPEIGYNQVQVLTRTSDEEVRAAVENALTVTDNEPVEECTIEISLPADIAKKAGNVAFTVTVTDKAGNVTKETLFISVVARPVEFASLSFDESAMTFSAVLVEPGSEALKETGFVWGVMNNPTLTLNNGKAATASPVTEPNGAISVHAELQEGVTYYARAYAVTVDDVTYYSEELTAGLGLPDYGTFTIQNNGDNTFTVTRSGGTAGSQTVYYRTVNGSAVGGTHFTHNAGTLTFQEGETAKTITVSESGANTAYSTGGTSKAATAYSNTHRTYSVELYRVTGGGSLGTGKTAMRTMTAADAYKVDRSIYTVENVKKTDYSSNYQWVTDRSGNGDGKIYWVSDRDENTHPQKYNFNARANVADRYSAETAYILNTADSYLYRYEMGVYEHEDCWEHAWMGNHAPNNAGKETALAGSYTKEPIALNDVVAGQAIWTANFQLGGSRGTTKYFPTLRTDSGIDTGNNEDRKRTVYRYNAASGSIVERNGSYYARLSIQDTVYSYFSASGEDYDRWYVTSFADHTLIDDGREPQILGIAPMAGGLYKVGDSFTVSVIFDEIVDSQNSTMTAQNTYLATSWGQAYYAGGADTNVLYFTGTVAANPEETLKVTGITGGENIKDMCDTTGTQTGAANGSTNAKVDASAPSFTVAGKGIANGTGTAVVTVTGDQSKTSSLRYVWSDSAAMPAEGWVEMSDEELAAAKGSAGVSLSIRKEAGSGQSNGKWYLHVIGTYDTTGATDYQYAQVDFGTKESPVPGSEPPALTVSADNTSWAVEREIRITASASGTDASLRYRASGGTTWTNLNITDTSVTVTENGYYTFQLTAGDQTITESVLVEKIDLNAPWASIGGLTADSVEAPRAGIYTKLALPISFGDGESGVSKAEYAWTDSAAEPVSWETLADLNTDVLSYTAVETAEAAKYLHIRVTDQVGHTYSVTSQPYLVISQTAVDTHAPKITLIGAPTQWTNDLPTLRWKLSDYENKNYMVTEPGGLTFSQEASGNFLATENGTYTVTVVDGDYGGSNTASVTVEWLDLTAPTVAVSGVPTGWEESAQSITLTPTDSQSGVGEAYYKVVAFRDEIPTEGLSVLNPAGQTVTISQDGVWYVYYKVYDKAGDNTAQTQREGNWTEGFAGPIRIDTKEPVLTVSGQTTGVSKEQGLQLTVKAEYGISGGQTTVNGSEIKELTETADPSGTGSTKEAAYTVSQKGTYAFVAQSGTGETDREEVTVYEAVFAAQNGTNDQTQLVISGGTLTEPAKPEKQGYTFAGWFTQTVDGSKWSFTDTIGMDTTLYARWTPNEDTRYVVRHWTQNMDGAEQPYDQSNYTLFKTEEKTDGITDGMLTLADLSQSISGCSYALGRVDGSTVEQAQVLADGSLEIDLYYSRESITGTAGINGTAVSGSTLTAQTAGTPVGTSLQYQWYYAGDTSQQNQDIEGAEQSTYILTDADIGKKLGVRVTAQDFKGELVSQPTEAVRAYLSGSILIEGDAVIGSVLTVNDSGLAPAGATVDWQWYRVDDGGTRQQIFGADSDTYQLTTEDFGYAILAQAAGTGLFMGTLETPQTEAVEKKTRETPKGITHTDETIDNKNDGQMHGLDFDAMEYRAGTEGAYQDFPADRFAEGTLSGLSDGEYQVRFKETAEYKPSDPVTVTIAPGGKYTVTLPDAQTGYSLEFAEGFDGTAGHDGSVMLLFTLLEGYSRTEDFAVSLEDGTRGSLTEPEEGAYLITGITGDLRVEVTGVADVTPPEAAISIQDSVWKKLLNTITFGLFFKDTQDVEITARDMGSGIKEVSYYLSEEGMSLEELEAFTGWTPYAGTFSIEEEKQYVIYAKAQDQAGNISYAGSDGLVLDLTPPSITGVTDGETYYEKQTAVIADSYLEKVTVNGEEITLEESGELVLDPEVREGAYVISAVDQAGNAATVTVRVLTRQEEEPEAPGETEDEDGGQTEDDNGTQDGGQAQDNNGTQDGGQAQDNNETQSGAQDLEEEPAVEQTPSQGGILSYEEAVGKPVEEPMQASYGQGTVRITVESVGEQGHSQGDVITGVILNTFDTVLQAALTEEEQQLVQNGEDAQIRLVVTKLITEVPETDKRQMEEETVSYARQIEGLTLGSYIDISLLKKVGGGEWQKLRESNEELEIVLDIPPKLPKEQTTYWVLRNHEGTCELLEDMDEAAGTVTIRTGLFSTYALLYTASEPEGDLEKSPVTGLDGGDGVGLGSSGKDIADCFWHWLILAMDALGAIAAVFVYRHKKSYVWIVMGVCLVLSALLAAAGTCVLDWLFGAAGMLLIGAAVAFFHNVEASKEDDLS